MVSIPSLTLSAMEEDATKFVSLNNTMTYFMFHNLSYRRRVKFIAFHIHVYCYLRLIDKTISIKNGQLSPTHVLYYHPADQLYVRIFLPRLLFLALLIHLPSSLLIQNTDFHPDHFLSYLLFLQRNGTSYRSRILAKN